MTKTDTKVELYMAGAREIGREHARSAASWAADGNTTDEHRRNVLRMLDDGDPQAWDFLPAMPNLSGEFADSPTPDSLFDDVVGENDTDMDADDLLDAICSAYEEGVSEVFEDACRAELSSCL